MDTWLDICTLYYGGAKWILNFEWGLIFVKIIINDNKSTDLLVVFCFVLLAVSRGGGDWLKNYFFLF